MSLRKVSLYILCLTVGFISCKKDSSTDIVPIEDRDRTEQQIIDNDSLIGYLETHYYNSSAFVLNADPSIADLIISELPADGVLPDPSNNTLLMDAVETKAVVYAETDYEFFILKLNQGGGYSPSFADKVRVSYEGFTLDNEVFDSAVTPVDLDLIGNGTTTSGTIVGWSKAFPYFSTAESFMNAGDGTVDYFNHGVGVMFLPSGLAYFSSSPSSTISSYSPLIFKFELFQMSQNDHDSDGVPSFMEDLNDDGELFTIDDDTDGDNIPNYIDADDDGDKILTKDEIVITTYNKATRIAIETLVLASNEVLIKIKEEINGTFTGTTITFTDTDGDGIPDYLDAI